MKFCPGFVSVSCVDGSCPVALYDEYAERGYDVIRDCDECYHSYEGCDGCIFNGTDLCDFKTDVISAGAADPGQ